MKFSICGAKVVILRQILAQMTLKNTLIYLHALFFSNL